MNIFFGLLFIIIGLSIFLGVFLFKILIALAFIVWGYSLLTRKRKNWHDMGRQTVLREATLNEVVILSPFNRIVHVDHFNGGKITMVLSGGELDLRETKTKTDTINLDVTTILSGIKIMVPKSWKVMVHGTAIGGGHVSRTAAEGAVTLHINGVVILGGIEIANE